MSDIATMAEQYPDTPAVIFDDGDETIGYRELEVRSRRLAARLRQAGLREGDAIAVLLGNEAAFFETYWAAMRIGLYFTPINWHLQVGEVEYILDNSDARAFVASKHWGDVAVASSAANDRLAVRLAAGGAIEGFDDYQTAFADVPDDVALDEPREGSTMLYSSGTTGRPKGVRTALPGVPPGDPVVAMRASALPLLFGMKAGGRYLCPAPLYHAAPLAFTLGQHRIGATAVVLRAFEPELALRVIQNQQVTTSQWVPTHFRRMLHLPEETRKRYDTSSLEIAVHAAAPCPVPMKRAMIEWWGPVLVEYYAGTEGGGTIIRSDEWLEHPGSVGRHWAGKEVHILDDDGQEIDEPRVEGGIYFEAPEPDQRFRYHKDDEKTAGSYRGDLFTLGDIGYKDEDGYLYLTDRKSNMIISGGANIYPQEVENHLASHPKVEDVAVIGVPNEDMGEEVKAVVIPRPGNAAGPALERELIDYCREGIAHYKCPKSVDFTDELPRTPTGKLVKRKLRDTYWEGHESHLI